MSKYRVVYERDENGHWIASVPSVRGAHSYGRTVDQARERIREALRLWIPDASHAELRDDILLPESTQTRIEQWRRAKTDALDAERRAAGAARHAADALTKRLRLSYRDAGAAMGLSRQRVQQLVTAAAIEFPISAHSHAKRAAKKARGRR